MAEEDGEETYSVIFSALKHPVRRRILRMLNQEELTYTQILVNLDIDTGHLNYHLESLGELLAKTEQGKYRLSDFGKAALELMSGVEETENNRQEREKLRSKRKITQWSRIIPVIALIIAGSILVNVSYVSTYVAYGSSGSLDRRDALIIQPNAPITSIDTFNVRHFPSDSLTTHYRTYFQIDVAYANVSLQIQLTERIYPMGNIPSGPFGSFYQPLLLIYNETWNGPLEPENGTTLCYTIQVPLKSPVEKGVAVANSFATYNTTITNLGKETFIRDSSGHGKMILLPNNTGSFSLQTSFPVIEETDYPYFYFGVAFLVLAAVTFVFSFVPMSIRQTWKRLKERSINKVNK